MGRPKDMAPELPTGNKTGAGFHGPNMTPEETAARTAELLERMRVGRVKAKERRAALEQQVIDLGGADLVTLRRHVKNRYWEIALWHVAGYENQVIAASLGYSHRTVIANILKRPEIIRLVDLIRAEQLRRVIEGEFGVRAQAKAAAPKVMRRVIEKAGAIDGADGKPAGMAPKDADQLRAADMVLTVSGDKIERHVNLNLHITQQMTDDELRALADQGVVPARFGPLLPAP